MNIANSLHAARELIRVKASGSEFVELVHAATNQDPWGPTGTQMDDVCRAFLRGSVEIMEEVKLRLKHRDKAWRPCYKSLLLLDHLARNVPESGLPAICSVAPTVRLISQTFYYTGSKGTDHGLSVRERAKKLCDLLSDGALLREEREKAALTRSKLSCAFGSDSGGGDYTSSRYHGISSSLPSRMQNYTSYESISRPGSTKEEQERYDMELAARLQREEESRAGMSIEEAERKFNRQVQHQSTTVAQATRNANLELARRLEEEEEQQRRQARCATEAVAPTNSTPATVRPMTPPPPKPETAPLKPEPPKTDFLDDLFAPPNMTSNIISQPSGWTTSASVQQQPSAPVDPFDDFLNSRVQHHHQQQQQQQQISPPFFSQSQQVSYGGIQPAVVPQQNQQFGMMEGNRWSNAPQVLTSMPLMGGDGGWSSGAPTLPTSDKTLPQGSWGMPSSTNNAHIFNGPQQVPVVADGNNMQGCVPFNNASGDSGMVNSMEKQMAQFTGQFGGQSQQSSKSLDALMAERRKA